MAAHRPVPARADVKQPAWLIDIGDEVRTLFKPRGTVGSISATRPDERSLVRAVEHAVDSDPARAGVIAELVEECRSRAAAPPSRASWRFLLGRLLMATGNPLEAREELERAAIVDPRDPRIPTHLALWYEAALLVATGAHVNVELPSAPAPDVTASAARFAGLDDPLSVDELAARSLELFDQALRFRLPRRDVQFLRKHAAIVRESAANADLRVRHRVMLRAV